ncbi:hypothetical protein ES332_A09G018200v1 [Gossypium tomentosum]|uniref:Heparanase-like protein 2 n=1 Tax=Gossypium tomentosum TaxID=34277 RepID=A0A5D2P048_GOSTO|nr:hypothetical protein ES332_A09G018200v1 [Gossypium tomentosum]
MKIVYSDSLRAAFPWKDGTNSIKFSIKLGNQLSGAGMGASVEAEQYGKDIVVLKNLVKELHPDPKTQPKVLGPSGYYDEKWFNSFLEVSGQDVVDGVTHHIYNLGPGIQICLNLVFIEEFLEAYLLLVGSVSFFPYSNQHNSSY